MKPGINLFAFTCSVWLLASGTALADGVVTKPGALPPETREQLTALIAQAKASDPEAFAAVAAVDTYKPAGIARMRHNQPTATRGFRQLGERALLPLIELAVFRANRGALTNDQWNALGDGLIQALAFLRNTQARPVLQAVFEHSANARWASSAAEGLGMLCGAEDRAVLLATLDASDFRLGAAVTGLQHCRTTEVADRIAEVLRDTTDEEVARRAVRALGYLGSSWALEADKRVSPTEGESISRITSDALLAAYLGRPDVVREQSLGALLMVGNRRTVDRINALRPSLNADQRAAADALHARLPPHAR